MVLKSWLPAAAKSPFSLANIPFGIISTKTSPWKRPATIIGSNVIDLEAFAGGNGFVELSELSDHLDVFSKPSLNAIAELGRPLHSKIRSYLQDVLMDGTSKSYILQKNVTLLKQVILPLDSVDLHLPLEIGDYTDFFAGINHASMVGSLFRGPENALQPNYKHLPVAYHGRASSVVVSGTPIRRPMGQILLNPAAKVKTPVFAPCRRLDIELELGTFICRANPLGRRVPISEAANSIFGYVLMNDWSARDVQTWEYVPLGPFNAKNFGTTISPWVILPDALAPFAVPGIQNDAKLLPHLQESQEAQKTAQYDIQLKVDLISSDGAVSTITRTSSKNLIWSFAQMVAHHTSGGCPLHPGDLLGSGTISGTESTARGSMLEQNLGGKQKIKLANGEERMFLEDGDTVTIEGVCGMEDFGLVGFGECSGQILKALDFATGKQDAYHESSVEKP